MKNYDISTYVDILGVINPYVGIRIYTVQYSFICQHMVYIGKFIFMCQHMIHIVQYDSIQNHTQYDDMWNHFAQYEAYANI